jgi:hypothetical protein
VHELVIIGQLCTAASATRKKTIMKEINGKESNSKKKSRTRESPA